MKDVTQQTVLVVDDEEAIAEAVRARLQSEGFQVAVAGDGPEAIALCEQIRPDLVVLDLMLPGMDGLEVCRQIQRDRWVPVLMLTARTEEADKVCGYRDYAGGRVVDSHVARIRRKLGEDGAEPRFIRTVHGVGYAFREPAEVP